MNTLIRNIKRKVLGIVAPHLPPKIAHTLLFHFSHGYWIDWKKPKTYDEKITYAMCYLIGKNESVFADKIRVRKYIREQGYGDFLPNIYGVWKNASEIDLTSLPNRFVIKTNNGFGENYYSICLDKQSEDIQSIKTKFDMALKFPFWKAECEYQYKYIEPCIFAEEYLDDGVNIHPIDYKVFCFSGKPEYVLVCTDRSTDLKLDFYDLQWNYLDIALEEKRSGIHIEKPEGLDTMIEVATKLSSVFPAARIDFYDIRGRVYIGEITLTSSAGHLKITDKWQKIWGEKMDLSKCNDRFTLADIS